MTLPPPHAFRRRAPPSRLTPVCASTAAQPESGWASWPASSCAALHSELARRLSPEPWASRLSSARASSASNAQPPRTPAARRGPAEAHERGEAKHAAHVREHRLLDAQQDDLSQVRCCPSLRVDHGLQPLLQCASASQPQAEILEHALQGLPLRRGKERADKAAAAAPCLLERHRERAQQLSRRAMCMEGLRPQRTPLRPRRRLKRRAMMRLKPRPKALFGAGALGRQRINAQKAARAASLGAALSCPLARRRPHCLA